MPPPTHTPYLLLLVTMFLALPFIAIAIVTATATATIVAQSDGDTYNIDRYSLNSRGTSTSPPTPPRNSSDGGAISIVGASSYGAKSNSSDIFRYQNRSYSLWGIVPPRSGTLRPNFYTENEINLNIGFMGLVDNGVVVYGRDNNSDNNSYNNYLLLVKPSGNTLVIVDYVILNWGQYAENISVSLTNIDSPQNVLDYNHDGIPDILFDFTDLRVKANLQVYDNRLVFNNKPIATSIKSGDTPEERLYRDNEALAYRFMRGEISYNELVNIAGQLRINTYDSSTLLQKISTETMTTMNTNSIPASALIEYMNGNITETNLAQTYGTETAKFLATNAQDVQTLLYKLYFSRSSANLIYNEAMDLSNPQKVNLAIQSWSQNLARIQNTIPELLQYFTSKDAIITDITLRLKAVPQ